MLKIFYSKVIDENNKEFSSNIAFAKDENMSPSGVDEMWFKSKITGEKYLERCINLGNGKFKIEKLK